MFGSRRLLLPVLIVLVLVASSLTAFASTTPPIVVDLHNATVPWLYPVTDTCQFVPAGLVITPDELTSDRQKAAVQRNLGHGVQQTHIADRITGTASDNLGGHYTFVYGNFATLRFDGSVVQVSMLDRFSLRGDNANYNFFFNWRWAYEADSVEVTPVQDANGQTVDIAVNPFPFATNDGVTESPEIIPGSWQRIVDIGTLDCDPL